MTELESNRNSSRILQQGRTTDGTTFEMMPTNRTHSPTPSSDGSVNFNIPECDPPPYEEVTRGENITSSRPSPPPPAYAAVLGGQFPELQTGSGLTGSDLTGNDFPEVVNLNRTNVTGTL